MPSRVTSSFWTKNCTLLYIEFKKRCVSCCDTDLCNEGGFIPKNNDQMEVPDYSYEALDLPNEPEAENSIAVKYLSFIYFLLFFY